MNIPKELLTKRLSDAQQHIELAKKALNGGDMVAYVDQTASAFRCLSSVDAWNVANRNILRSEHIERFSNPNEETDQRRENEDFKRNIENRDRLGYEY